MLKGKTVLLGVTGSIAAYKTASLASMLVKKGVKVHVLMTENAAHFINPITFESLTGNKCLVDTFDRNFEFSVEHVALAKQADVVMITPASANVIGKIAHGIADDMLTTTVMACRCKKILAPAMNTNMYENPILQDNLDICRRYGMEVITPAWGYLACGDTGAGKMPEPEVLYEYILREAGYPGDLAGRRILVTAGPTRESIDPVRYITNHSTGPCSWRRFWWRAPGKCSRRLPQGAGSRISLSRQRRWRITGLPRWEQKKSRNPTVIYPLPWSGLTTS